MIATINLSRSRFSDTTALSLRYLSLADVGQTLQAPTSYNSLCEAAKPGLSQGY